MDNIRKQRSIEGQSKMIYCSGNLLLFYVKSVTFPFI